MTTTSGTYDVAFSVSNGGSWVYSNTQTVKLPGTKVNFRVLYHDSLVDSIGSETEVAAYARGVFADAAQAFRNTWGLHFVPSISKAPQIFTVDDCPYRYNKSCNTSPPPGGGPPEPPCPSMSGSCTYCDNKHRCVSRLFNEVVDSYKHRPSTSYDMTTLFFAFNTDCPSLGGGEYSVIWLKDTENYDDPPYPAPGHYSRTEQLSYLWNVRRLQHEISHCFGCLDNDETNPTCVDEDIERCLFNTGFDDFIPKVDNYNIGNLWCSNCRQRFNKNKFN